MKIGDKVRCDCQYCDNATLYGDRLICNMTGEEAKFPYECDDYNISEYIKIMDRIE